MTPPRRRLYTLSKSLASSVALHPEIYTNEFIFKVIFLLYIIRSVFVLSGMFLFDQIRISKGNRLLIDFKHIIS